MPLSIAYACSKHHDRMMGVSERWNVETDAQQSRSLPSRTSRGFALTCILTNMTPSAVHLHRIQQQFGHLDVLDAYLDLRRRAFDLDLQGSADPLVQAGELINDLKNADRNELHNQATQLICAEIAEQLGDTEHAVIAQLDQILADEPGRAAVSAFNEYFLATTNVFASRETGEDEFKRLNQQISDASAALNIEQRRAFNMAVFSQEVLYDPMYAFPALDNTTLAGSIQAGMWAHKIIDKQSDGDDIKRRLRDYEQHLTAALSLQHDVAASLRESLDATRGLRQQALRIAMEHSQDRALHDLRYGVGRLPEQATKQQRDAWKQREDMILAECKLIGYQPLKPMLDRILAPTPHANTDAHERSR